jgi:hypothetical protein
MRVWSGLTRTDKPPCGVGRATVVHKTLPGMTGTKQNRAVPLVLLGVSDDAALEPVATLLGCEGMGLVVALGESACLRVASAVRPDVILLDPRLPRALLSLLRGHPLLRSTQISWSQALGGTDSRQRQQHAPSGGV